MSPRFAELWEQRPVRRHIASRKTVVHPEVGEITLDCDALTVRGSDLRMVVYTAAARLTGRAGAGAARRGRVAVLFAR